MSAFFPPRVSVILARWHDGQVGDGVYLPPDHFNTESKVKGGVLKTPRSYIRAKHMPDPQKVVRGFALIVCVCV